MKRRSWDADNNQFVAFLDSLCWNALTCFSMNRGYYVRCDGH